jgi:hypothetical protein
MRKMILSFCLLLSPCLVLANSERLITNEFRQDLKKLVVLLTNSPDLQWINDVIDDYEWDEDEEFEANYSVSEEELITFRQVEILGDILQPEFMLQIDWKEGVDELKLGIEDLLLRNFGVSRVSFPNMRYYDSRTTVSSDGVLEGFNRELKKQGFSLANVISGDDSLWIIVYPTAAHNEVEYLVNQLGGELE